MFKPATEIFKILTGLILKFINLTPTFPTSFHHTFKGSFFMFLNIQAIDNTTLAG